MPYRSGICCLILIAPTLSQVSSLYVLAWSLGPKQGLLGISDIVLSERVKECDFIVRLEKTFRLAYGHEPMSTETHNTLLYGQLHEGLVIRLMEAPSVSGATDDVCLCMAAWNVERKQAELYRGGEPTRH